MVSLIETTLIPSVIAFVFVLLTKPIERLRDKTGEQIKNTRESGLQFRLKKAAYYIAHPERYTNYLLFLTMLMVIGSFVGLFALIVGLLIHTITFPHSGLVGFGCGLVSGGGAGMVIAAFREFFTFNKVVKKVRDEPGI